MLSQLQTFLSLDLSFTQVRILSLIEVALGLALEIRFPTSCQLQSLCQMEVFDS